MAGLAVGTPTVRSAQRLQRVMLSEPYVLHGMLLVDAGLEPPRQRLHARRRTVDDRRPPRRTHIQHDGRTVISPASTCKTQRRGRVPSVVETMCVSNCGTTTELRVPDHMTSPHRTASHERRCSLELTPGVHRHTGSLGEKSYIGVFRKGTRASHENTKGMCFSSSRKPKKRRKVGSQQRAAMGQGEPSQEQPQSPTV